MTMRSKPPIESHLDARDTGLPLLVVNLHLVFHVDVVGPLGRVAPVLFFARRLGPTIVGVDVQSVVVAIYETVEAADVEPGNRPNALRRSEISTSNGAEVFVVRSQVWVREQVF